MAKNYALQADARDGAGKGAARSLRRDNKIPAVIYGDKKEPVTITLDSNTVNLEYNKGQMQTTLCDLSVGSDKHVVLARDIQLHPVTDNVMHVDFLRVTAKTKIVVDIPVQFINEDKSPGLQEKGILSVTRYDVQLMCSAMSIPDYIEVDLTGWEMHQTIKISDVKLPEGAVPVLEFDFPLANILEPKKMEDLEAELAEMDEAAAAAAAEEGAEDGEAAEAAEGSSEAETSEGGDDKAEG